MPAGSTISCEVTGLPSGAIPFSAVPYGETTLANSSVDLQYYSGKWYARIIAITGTIAQNASCDIRIYYYIP